MFFNVQAKYAFSRRFALLFGILLSGGMLILPRIPLLVLFFLFSLVATGFRGIPLKATRKVWLLLGGIFLITLIRPGQVDLESLLIRYANFIGGVLFLAIYLRSGYAVLSKDLFALFPWMAIQAILTFLLANWLPFLFAEINMPGGGVFSTLFFIFNYHIIIENFSGFIRPNGFFWEPGVYQIYMNLYLYLAVFIFRSKKHAVLAVLAIACIYSTTGLLIAILLLIAALLKQLSVTKVKHRIIVAVVALLMFPLILMFVTQNIEEKFFGESQGSSLIRQYDMIAGLNVMANYPILGIGFDHSRYQQIVSSYFSVAESFGFNDVPERSTSNGIIYLGYTLGVPLAFLIIVALWGQRIFKDRFLIGMLLLLSMLGEALILTPFFLMFVFSFFVDSKSGVIGSHQRGGAA